MSPGSKPQETPGFSLLDLMKDCGVSPADVSERTVNRFLKSQGFHYLQTRKKGILRKQDLAKRVTFCSVMQRIYSPDVWTRKVAFYLDGVSFAYKRNPLEVGTTGHLIMRTRPVILLMLTTQTNYKMALTSQVLQQGFHLHLPKKLAF